MSGLARPRRLPRRLLKTTTILLLSFFFPDKTASSLSALFSRLTTGDPKNPCATGEPRNGPEDNHGLRGPILSLAVRCF